MQTMYNSLRDIIRIARIRRERRSILIRWRMLFSREFGGEDAR